MKKMVLPTIALRGMTVLPDMVIHFDINRKKSIHAVEKAMQTNETIFLLTQRDIDTANPVQDDLYSVGTVAKVKELIKLPKGIVRVLVAGKYKGMVNTVSESDGMLISDIVIAILDTIVNTVKRMRQCAANAGKQPKQKASGSDKNVNQRNHRPALIHSEIRRKQARTMPRATSTPNIQGISSAKVCGAPEMPKNTSKSAKYVCMVRTF